MKSIKIIKKKEHFIREILLNFENMLGLAVLRQEVKGQLNI
jgi:hypothetical protein